MSIQVRPDTAGPGPRITGFAGTGFRIDGESYDAALLTPEWVSGWDAPALDALDAAALGSILSIGPRPEFLLLGTGPTMARPSPAFVAAVEALEIGVEAMDSRAAARAWGVLRAEERWIVAALLPL